MRRPPPPTLSHLLVHLLLSASVLPSLLHAVNPDSQDLELQLEPGAFLLTHRERGGQLGENGEERFQALRGRPRKLRVLLSEPSGPDDSVSLSQPGTGQTAAASVAAAAVSADSGKVVTAGELFQRVEGGGGGSTSAGDPVAEVGALPKQGADEGQQQQQPEVQQLQHGQQDQQGERQQGQRQGKEHGDTKSTGGDSIVSGSGGAAKDGSNNAAVHSQESTGNAAGKRAPESASTSSSGSGASKEGSQKQQQQQQQQQQQHQETSGDDFFDENKLVIGVTPTYARAYQALYINHVVATLRLVAPPFLWIVVEAPNKTDETTALLQSTAGRCLPEGDPNCNTVEYVHIDTGTPEKARWNKAVAQRNAALEYIEKRKLSGIVYFMDDDNTYSPELFDELRKVRRVAAFPVGFLFSQEYALHFPYKQSRPTVERPLVRAKPDGTPQVYGWETFEWSIPHKAGGAPRTFCADMAGFAFNSEYLWRSFPDIRGYPKHPVRFTPVSGGYLETTFVGRLVPRPQDLEGHLAKWCTEVLVWHAHAEADKSFPYPANWRLPQPQNLVPATNEGADWPYVVDGVRHGFAGQEKEGLRLGYKPGIPKETAPATKAS